MRQQPDVSDPYQAIAAYYDAEHDQFTDDLVMYRHLAEMADGPILELACGSGRILEAVIEQEHPVTGIDTSAIMIERCRARFAERDRKPHLQVGSMVDRVADPGSQSLVIIGLSSLHHVVTQSEQRSALQAASDALRTGGMLVLDLLNPFVALTGPDERVSLETTLEIPDGTLQKFSVQTIDPAEQHIRHTVWYDLTSSGGAVQRVQTTMDLRVVFPSELELLLELAGLTSWQIYGSYDLDSFDASSPRLIVMAEKHA